MIDTDAPDTTAETPSDAEQAPEAPDTPPTPETDATGQPGGQDDADGAEHQGDNFPRHVVEKLRKENATYRDRAKAAEQTVTALQRQAAEQHIKAAGMKPEAVWAVSKLDEVLDDQGAIDTAKLGAAMGTARAQLGIAQRTPAPGRGRPLQSGAGAPHEKPTGFVDAFGPKRK